jgi:hypothetical protein
MPYRSSGIFVTMTSFYIAAAVCYFLILSQHSLLESLINFRWHVAHDTL